MKTFAMIVAAGIASSAAAQDVIITVDPTVGTVSMNYVDATPIGAIQQLWSSISVRLTGDAPITIGTQSSVYTSALTPTGAAIGGNGTGNVTFVGEAGGALFGGAVDSSNPFAPFTFNYGGTLAGFNFQLFGQNSITFVQPPFGNPQNLVNANGTAGPISFRVDIVPAPASAALLGLGGLAAIRRRR